MNEWIGKTEHDVVLKMGSPNSTVSDGASGKIIRYEKSSSNSTTTYGKYPFYNPATTYNIYANTTTITQTWYAEFFIDSTKKFTIGELTTPILKWKTSLLEIMHMEMALIIDKHHR